MSLGVQKTGSNDSRLSLDAFIKPLKKAKLTGEGVERMLKGEFSEKNIRRLVSQYYGINDLTQKEITAIRKSKKGQMNHVLGPIISSRSVIGWTTTGHTGEDVFLYHYGLNRPLGMIENTQIARLCTEDLGMDLNYVEGRLFVRADEAFAKIGASVAVDDKTDPANPKLIATKGDKIIELPFSKNIIRLRSEKEGTYQYKMEGITVFAPKTKRVYVPQQAIDWVNSL
jgi:alkaline phosphatase